MSYDAVIFDCDGTLVDSEGLACQAIVDHAAAFGVRLTLADAVARFTGGRMADVVTFLEGLRGAPLPADFVAGVRTRMAAAFAAHLRPIDGALDLVRSLALPHCVASSGPREKIELTLSITGLLPYFEGRIFSAYEVGSWKPNPALFLHAARKLGADPQRCAVVEDSTHGIEAGLAAGMTVFALVDGAARPDLPREARPIGNLRELIPLLR
ncbi:MAG: HAD family hydrolase [Steroidobacteraceae bacterium]